jgi:hypothetical protein
MFKIVIELTNFKIIDNNLMKEEYIFEGQLKLKFL